MATVAFIGLGTMGGGIAQRLLEAGHQVIGYNRTPTRADRLVEQGLQLVTSPRAAAEAASVVFSMVADDAALWAVTGGDDGILAGLRKGAVYADMSTVSPTVSRQLANDVKALGGSMVDLPVMAGVPHFRDNLPLMFLAGGYTSAIDQLRPIIDSLHAIVVPIGRNGQALVMKAALNLQLPIQMAMVAETLLLAERSGISRETALTALHRTPILPEAARWRLEEFVPNPDADAWHPVSAMRKDLKIALELGTAHAAPLPLTALVDQLLAVCQARGWAGRDFAALTEVNRSLPRSAPSSAAGPGSWAG